MKRILFAVAMTGITLASASAMDNLIDHSIDYTYASRYITHGFNVGDSKADSQLDPDEVWLYTASEHAQEGLQTNTATATAIANSKLLLAAVNASVVVFE